MHNSFEIYKSDNKSFHWDINNILLILLLIFGFLKILKIDYLSKIAENGLICIFITGTIMCYANIFRKRPLNGVLEGKLIFNSENIFVNDKRIEIETIQKIFLRTNDYEGRELNTYRRAGLFPNISNGTNNLLDLNLKNGSKIKLFFKIEYENQTEELQSFIISLFKNKLITEKEAIEIIHFNNDYMYDIFITALNKKELD